MRIGININHAIGEKTGIGRYAQELVKGLARVDRTNKYLLYSYFWHRFPPYSKAPWLPRQDNFFDFGPSNLFIKYYMERTKLPHDWVLGRPDIIHSTHLTAPRLQRAKLVVTVPDLTFVTHTQFHVEENINYCSEQMNRAKNRADHFIAISDNTKHDLVARLRIPEGKITVTHLAADIIYRPLEDEEKIRVLRKKYGIDRDFLLFVGSIEPRKNVQGVLHAISKLSTGLKKEYMFVAAGGTGWLNNEVYNLIENLGLTGIVKFLGYLDDDELPVLYNAATAFVYPSFYEGFGLPPLEAMACGTPVITSNVSSIPEVVGDAAFKVDPANIEELATAIEKVLSDNELRRQLSEAGIERSKKFSWKKTAEATLAVYKKVAGK